MKAKDSSSATTAVRLIGGPTDWHGQTRDPLTEADLEAPRESLGSYLVSSYVPGHPDPGARAVYEPDADPASANVWFFRGWVPWSPHDPEGRCAPLNQAVDVYLDENRLPTEWDLGNTNYHVDRVLAHWQASGEDTLGGV